MVVAVGGLWALCLIVAVRAEPPGPIARGQQLFENRCARCHGMNGDGEGGLGPSLVGVVGRQAASRPDFRYSPALRAKGRVWTPELIDEWLTDPQAFAPGSDMEVNSPDPAERSAMIAFVGQLK